MSIVEYIFGVIGCLWGARECYSWYRDREDRKLERVEDKIEKVEDDADSKYVTRYELNGQLKAVSAGMQAVRREIRDVGGDIRRHAESDERQFSELRGAISGMSQSLDTFCASLLGRKTQ